MRLTVRLLGIEVLHIDTGPEQPGPPPDGDHLAGQFEFGFHSTTPRWSPLSESDD